MRRSDLKDVMALACRSASGILSPKSLGEMLRRRNRVWLVAERGRKVVGFMVYEQTKTKLVILCLVTAPHQRRRHIARVLIFRAMGFRAVFISPGHFGGDDAYLMRYTPLDALS